MGRNYSSKSSAINGFTLVELLIVVAVVGILAGSVLVAVNPAQQLAKSRDAQRKNDLEKIKVALETYYNDNSKYPVGINGKISEGNSALEWGDKWLTYMAKLPKDPSDQDYCYKAPEDGSYYRLYAKLERSSDSRMLISDTCLDVTYNYSVNSSNIAALPTLIPVPPTATPVPPTPTPKPAQTPVKTNHATSNLIYNSYLKGRTSAFRFRTNVNGTINALWAYRAPDEAVILRLYSDAGGDPLHTTNIVGRNGEWVQGVLSSPITVAKDVYYRVTIYSLSGGYNVSLKDHEGNSRNFPVTYDSVTITDAYYGDGDNFPTTPQGYYFVGLVDINFIPD